MAEHRVSLLAWCLMTNHVHLVLVPKTAEGLELSVGRTHWRYTQAINGLHQRVIGVIGAAISGRAGASRARSTRVTSWRRCGTSASVNESTCVLTSPSAAKGRRSPARRARSREAGCCDVDEYPPVASLAARQDGLSHDDAFRCAPTSSTRARREHDVRVNESTSVLTSPSAAKGRSSPARRARSREAGCCDVDEYPPVASLAARQDGLSHDDAFRCATTIATTSTTRARRTRRRIDVLSNPLTRGAALLSARA